MCRCIITLTCVIALLSVSRAEKFLPVDVRAGFRRLGTNKDCPALITHRDVKRRRGTDQLVVEHREISIAGEQCTSFGRLVISPFTANVMPPNHGVELYRQLLSDGSEFYTARDSKPRICSQYSIANNTVYFFTNTERRVRLNRVENVSALVPGTNYMIYAEPGGKRCAYRSTAKPKTRPKRRRVCFPADAVVQIEGGKTKRMDEVSIGDSVLVAPATYSQVFMFTHRDADLDAEFVHLRLKCGAAVQLTPGHYIYAGSRLIAARDVQIGDALMLDDGSTSNVVSTTRVEKQGIFNPQTLHGNIVVNGVVASTFTELIEPSVAHCLLAPLRSLFMLLGVHTNAFDGAHDTLFR